MNFLLLIREEGKFDASEVAGVFREMPGTRELRIEDGIGRIVECEYWKGEDGTILRLKADAETISIAGMGEAAIDAIHEFSRRMPGNLRLVDDDYTIDVVVTGDEPLDTLRRMVMGEPPTESP